MTKKYRKFTAAEKSKVALEAIKGELTIAQIASKYTVHSTQINTWKKAALAQLPEAFSGRQTGSGIKRPRVPHGPGPYRIYSGKNGPRI